MSDRRLAIRRAGNLLAFHRDGHFGWRRIAAGLLLANVLTIAAFAGYVHFHSTVYITVAATPDGRLIRLTPLDEPIMSDSALRAWTVASVTAAFTLGHHDFRRRLADIRPTFTDAGYESFVKGLEESLFLDRLRKNHQVSAAVATGVPVITEARKYQGRLGWEIQFPFLITFSAGPRRLTQKLVARVLVVRTQLSERATGIGIAQLIATEGSSPS